MRATVLCAITAVLAAASFVHTQSPAANWAQFRGPGGSGRSAGLAPPAEFGPTKNLLWKTPLPAGHSSPVIWGDRIFLTAFDANRKMLEVIALTRSTGAVSWRRDVPADQVEPVHQVSSPATATPVVDGERVYVYFASVGLAAFDLTGTPLWTLPLPRVQTPFGSGTSPVLAGEHLILNRQAPTDPFLMAVDRRSGKIVWRQAHEIPAGLPSGFASYATPLVVGDEVVIHGMRMVESFAIATGERRWFVTINSTGTSSPVQHEGVIYVATWSPFGEADQTRPLPDFATILRDHDADGSGTIAQAELPAELYIFSRPDTPAVPGATMTARQAFARFDANKNLTLDAGEWAGGLAVVKSLMTEHGLLAIRPGGRGDITATHVLWKERSSIPEVPSPLVHGDRVLMVRNGGILTSVDRATGRVAYRARLGAPGPYYSSPIAISDRLFIASGDGTIVVFGSSDALNVIARNDLGESIFATPAVADGTLYVRTASGLSAFAEKPAGR